MGLRSKSRVRLLVLVASVVGVTAALGGAYVLRKSYLNRQIAEHKPKGLQAYKDGELVTAVNELGQYLAYHGDDLEAIEPYVDARLKLPETDGLHLRQAMSQYRRLVALKPNDWTARATLARLYLQLRMFTETVQAADDLVNAQADALKVARGADAAATARALTGALAARAKDPETRTKYIEPLSMALKAEMMAQQQLHRGDFNATGESLLAIDAGWESIGLRLMVIESQYGDAEERRKQCLAALEGILRKVDENDLQAKVQVAGAYLAYGEPAAATRTLDAALKMKPASDDDVMMLAGTLDRMDRFTEAAALVEKGRSEFKSEALENEHLRRLMYQEQYEKVAQETANADLRKKAPAAAMRVMALGELSRQLEAAGKKEEAARRKEEAGATLKVLEECGQRWDTRATGWHDVLTLEYMGESPSLRKLIDACRNGLERDPRNAFLCEYLARAYHASGDVGEAITQWSAAAQLAPAWARPLIGAADLDASMGNAADALTLARKADLRLPGNRPTLEIIAVSWWQSLRQGTAKGTDADPAALLKFIDARRAEIGLNPNVLHLEVELLNRQQGPAAATARVTEVLSRAEKSDAAVLLGLAEVTRALKLGEALETRCLARYEELRGVTAELAMTRCVLMLAPPVGPSDNAAFKPDLAAVKAYFQEARKKAGDVVSSEKALWDMNWCRLLESTQDQAAHDAWRDTSTLHQDNALVLWSALEAPSVWRDRDLTGKIIGWLSALNGETGLRWRLAKSQWLLNAKETDQTQDAIKLLRQAVASSPGSNMAHKLLGQAFLATKSLPEATQEFLRARELAPQDPEPLLNLAYLYSQQQDVARAREQIQRVAALRDLNDSQRQTAGVMAAQFGDSALALKLLENDKSAAAMELVPTVYWQMGRFDEALQGFQALLKGKPSAATIERVLLFYAETKNAPEAESLLSTLDKYELTEAQRKALGAAYLARSGKMVEASAGYAEAARLDPKTQTYRKLQVAMLLLAGKADDAVKAAADAGAMLTKAEAAMPENAAWAAIEKLGARGLASADVRAYMASCVIRPGEGKGMKDAVAWLLQPNQDGRELARGLQSVAQRNEESLALQVLAIESLRQSGQAAEAADLGRRTLVRYPNEPRVMLATGVSLASLNKWEEVIALGRGSVGRGTPGDLGKLVIQAYLKNNQAAEAEKLVPWGDYRKRLDEPGISDVIYLSAWAQTAQGRFTEIESDLWPRVQENKFPREFWVMLATAGMPANRADVSRGWLGRLESSIKADDVNGQRVVALAWLALAARNNRAEEDLNRALAAADRIAAATGASKQQQAGILMEIGLVFDTAQDLARARKCYQQVLALDPTAHPAANNLAMVLLRQGDAAGAEALARQAVAAQNIAPYLDTLANVLSAEKKYDDALARIADAQKLEPGNAEWLLTQAEILVEQGRRDEAGKVMAGFDRRMPEVARTPLKARYDAVMKSIAGAP